MIKDVKSAKAVLFDLDGVLVDAADWHFEALNRAMAPFGFQMSLAEHRREFIGWPTEIKIKKLIQRRLLPATSRETILTFKRTYFSEIMTLHCKPDSGRIRLLQELRRRRIRIGIVSNAQHASVEAMLELSRLRSFVEVVIGGDQVKLPKPNPEMYCEAIRRMGLLPTQCMAVEDGIYGMAAANAAGLRVTKVSEWEDPNLMSVNRLIVSASQVRNLYISGMPEAFLRMTGL